MKQSLQYEMPPLALQSTRDWKIKFTGEKRASSVVVCISLARLKSVNLLNGRKFCKAITHVAYGPADRLAQVKEEGTTE